MLKDTLVVFICYAVNTSEIIASLREIVKEEYSGFSPAHFWQYTTTSL